MEIIESWWHRLTKIALIGGVVMASLATLAVSAVTWAPPASTYSWNSVTEDTGPWTPCSITTYDSPPASTVICGDLYSAEALYYSLVEAGKIADTGEFGALSEHDKAKTMADFLARYPQTYRTDPKLSPRNVALSAGAFLLAVVLSGLLAAGVWRVILYIVHGGGAKLVR
ncbi:hypothetical protein ATCM_03750 [Stenotrophomonas sp. ATCM1_4]|uniref:hypothetical protein n=1 Tax=Stenotrophomonas sp. ATCM1_4 TaxID=2259330 RepID=UPI00104D9811|nr:hypothetical protein [Stenotrophomonas sp. ATCM1_4]TDB26831.1 hypothetical protein ATCM_03750 [Stenotrophomonas sp. ATCM1_4]